MSDKICALRREPETAKKAKDKHEKKSSGTLTTWEKNLIIAITVIVGFSLLMIVVRYAFKGKGKGKEHAATRAPADTSHRSRLHSRNRKYM